MNLAKGFTLTVFAILFTTLAVSSPAELDIFPKEATTKIDNFAVYEVRVTNTGPVEDIYRMSSSHTSEMTIAPRRVPEPGKELGTLEPGESETVNVWFNPDTDREEGRYSFDITARSQANDEEYTATGFVNVVADYKVNVEVNNPGVVCKNEEAVYDVRVTNEGTQQETFEMTADAGRFSQNQVRLESGESTNVTLTRQSGIAVTDKSFNIGAESTDSYASDVTTTSFEVENCYDSRMTVNPGEQSVAAETPAEYEVKVRNLGTRTDVYDLSADRGQLEDTELTIASGDSKTTTLTYTPEDIANTKINVKAEGQSSSSESVNLESYNGQDMEVSFQTSKGSVCEEERFERRLRVENTGEAVETYSVQVNRGDLSESEIQLAPGEARILYIDLDSSNYNVGTQKNVRATVTATTFDDPQKTTTSSFNVENCHDLKMTMVPKIASAGENRSTLYEIHLENTGTQRNTYTVSTDGPEWISTKPREVTVESGEMGKSYIYAGVPFKKEDGKITITAVSEGEKVRRSETVELVIGEEVKKAIKSDEGRGLTGYFQRAASGMLDGLTAAGTLPKVAVSILLALVLTAVILYRE